MDIEEIKKYMKFRGMKWPKKYLDAVLFAITEMGEIVDAHMRQDPEWVRNNERDTNIGHEMADAYQMLEIACYLATGKSLDENLLDKWKEKGYDLKQIKSYEFFFNANPGFSKEELKQLWEETRPDPAKIMAENPDLEYKGVLGNSTAEWWAGKLREGLARTETIFGLPVAKIEQTTEDKWWNSLTEDEKKIVVEECRDYFQY